MKMKKKKKKISLTKKKTTRERIISKLIKNNPTQFKTKMIIYQTRTKETTKFDELITFNIKSGIKIF